MQDIRLTKKRANVGKKNVFLIENCPLTEERLNVCRSNGNVKKKIKKTR